MMVVPSWTSERLVYRITSRADVENVVAALSDLKTSESIYWVPKPYTIADAEDWIARAERGWLSGEEFLFSAFGRISRGLHRLPSISIRQAMGKPKSAIGSQAHSRGKALPLKWSHSSSAIAASSMQGAHLFATTDTKNAASQMVLKKNGFQKVAGIDIQSHDGKSRTSFLFERVG